MNRPAVPGRRLPGSLPAGDNAVSPAPHKARRIYQQVNMRRPARIGRREVAFEVVAAIFLAKRDGPKIVFIFPVRPRHPHQDEKIGLGEMSPNPINSCGATQFSAYFLFPPALFRVLQAPLPHFVVDLHAFITCFVSLARIVGDLALAVHRRVAAGVAVI